MRSLELQHPGLSLAAALQLFFTRLLLTGACRQPLRTAAAWSGLVAACWTGCRRFVIFIVTAQLIS
jgi:hypothetical protein